MLLKDKLPTAVFLLLVISVVFSMFMRFSHLDTHVLSYDEAFTSLRISGYAEAELITDLSTNVRPVKVAYLEKYQDVDTEGTLEKTVRGTIEGLAKEEPQLTPLYYLTAKFWSYLWNDGSIPILRSWSALVSLLGLPLIYWLCLELFEAHFTASIATILLAVSPFFLLYSRDARHYSLWAVSILLISAALLRALRIKTNRSWLLYGIAVSISLYAGLLSFLVLASHGVYVFVTSRFRFTQDVLAYLAASALGVIGFSPWIAVIWLEWSQLRRVSGQTDSIKLGLLELARGWLRQPGKLMYDLNPPLDLSSIDKLLQYVVTGGCLVFICYAIFFLCRTTPQRIWLLILGLIGITEASLILQDLILGGQAATGGMSNIPKYLMPCFLGILLATAHLFSSRIIQPNMRSWQRRAWQGGFALLLLTQIINNITIWQSSDSLGSRKDTLQVNAAALEIINQAKNAVLITDMSGWDVMYFSHLLNSDISIWTKPTCYSCNLTVDPTTFAPGSQQLSQFDQVFFFPQPTEAMLAWAKQQTDFRQQQRVLVPGLDPFITAPGLENKLVSLERRS